MARALDEVSHLYEADGDGAFAAGGCAVAHLSRLAVARRTGRRAWPPGARRWPGWRNRRWSPPGSGARLGGAARPGRGFPGRGDHRTGHRVGARPGADREHPASGRLGDAAVHPHPASGRRLRGHRLRAAAGAAGCRPGRRAVDQHHSGTRHAGPGAVGRGTARRDPGAAGGADPEHHHLRLPEIQQQTGFEELFDTSTGFENFTADTGATGLWEAGFLRGEQPDLLPEEARDSRGFGHYPLTLVVFPGPRLRIELSYRQDVFDAGFVQSLVECLKHLMTALAEEPERSVAQIPLLTAVRSNASSTSGT